MQKLALLVLFSICFYHAHAAAPDPVKGKTILEGPCASCHTAGKRAVGPDLTGVKDRWNGDMKKITEWVHNPSKFLGKDPYIIKLQAAFNGSVMSGQPQLSDQDVADVIEYANNPSALAGGGGGGGGEESFIPVPHDSSLLKLLFFGALILVIIIFYLSSRVYNTFVKKDDESGDTDGFDGPAKGINWQKVNAWLMPIFGIAFIGGLLYECTIHLGPHYALPESASDIGKDIDRLFLNTVYVTGIVFFVTQILLFYYAFKYQRKEGRKALFYSHNNTIEFVWTIIPAIVLTYLVLDGFNVWRKATSNPDNKPFVVEAFARQFDWHFRYPGKDGILGKVDFRKISAENPLGIDYDDPNAKDDYITEELHMPSETNIKLKLRSQDVIHAAYLPHFRMQLYAQPGMENFMRFKTLYTTQAMRAKTDNPKFVYELACNQLCGAAHYNMRRIIVVEDEKDFERWQSTQKSAFSTYKPAEKPAAPKATASLLK